MADVAISGLTALGGAPATNDLLVLVDVSDTTQAPTGTTKKATVTNLFTSPTMTTVTISSGGLTVSAGTTALQALTASTLVLGGSGVFGASTVNFSGFVGQAKFFGGSTGLSIRNAADSADNLVMTDAGAFTLRSTTTIQSGGLTVTAGGLTVSAGATALAGDLAINTNKFTVAAASGNTAIAGTLAVTGAITASGGVVGNLTGNVTGAVTGNASTASALQTARTINGTSFDGTTNITVTAAAGTLTGTTLNSTVVASSLTSVSATLAFGGTTSSFPMLKRSSAVLNVRLADDSADADFQARQINCSLGLTATDNITTNAQLTAQSHINTTAGVYKVGAVQVVGARNTGWSAQTATPAKTDLGASPTVGALASWAAAIQAALTTHGLIGT